MNTEIIKTDQVQQNLPTSSDAAAKISTREPRHRIVEDSGRFCVSIDLPGALKESIQIEQKGEELVINAERRDELPENCRPLHLRAGPCNYRLSLKLGASIDPGAINARYRDGVLALILEKRKVAPNRIIEVS